MRRPLLCAVLACLAVSPPLAAGQARPQSVDEINIVFVDSSDVAANRWVEDNPEYIAVAIRLGSKATVDPKNIVYWLRKDFLENGGCRTHFIFERGGLAGSSVAFRSRNHAWGPFTLANSRTEVAKACAQHSFEMERGLH